MLAEPFRCSKRGRRRYVITPKCIIVHYELVFNQDNLGGTAEKAFRPDHTWG